MGDSDKVEGSEQMVKLAIQQLIGFWIGAHVAGAVVADQMTRLSMLVILFPNE